MTMMMAEAGGFNYLRGAMALAAAVVGGGCEEVVALNNDDDELFNWLLVLMKIKSQYGSWIRWHW